MRLPSGPPTERAAWWSWAVGRRLELEPALRALIGPWLDRPARVVACGMVGARQGWTEAAYARVPGPPLGAGLTRAPSGPGLDVRIVAGLAQDDPPDVMRGGRRQGRSRRGAAASRRRV